MNHKGITINSISKSVMINEDKFLYFINSSNFLYNGLNTKAKTIPKKIANNRGLISKNAKTINTPKRILEAILLYSFPSMVIPAF